MDFSAQFFIISIGKAKEAIAVFVIIRANHWRLWHSINVISSALWEGFINILNEFKLRYPSYTFDFIEISPNSQPEAIKNNKIDIGICRFADIQNTYPLSTSLLVAENMCLAVSDTHPMSTRKLVNLKELKDEAFVVLNREKSKSTEFILKHCMQADFHANIVYEVIEPQTQLAFVASNQAVAVVPESYANIKWAHIKFIKIAESIPASLCIIYDEQNEQETVDKILEVARGC
ncbi:LysR substrate-binding domain-containing protein [Vibrio algicola]|uniref:LysR substrate-binding domain-containing protein n=1 Tax=Vibrio algicola TaxID=2662262 RepID=A0A5Q0TIU7_9VIBR|nr:LysR substrate-binding domain-containing protein [Vibrio algicola]